MNPHIIPLTKVIPLKLFLDMVPSSFEDVTRATFSELPEKKWRERHFICFGFVSYHRCFLHSQPPVCTAELSFVFLLVWLFIFCLLFGLREFQKT